MTKTKTAGSAPAKIQPPAATAADAMRNERTYGARNYDPLPVVLARGEGVWLWDDEGRRYLDGVSSLWCNVHGHRHPQIDAAVRELSEETGIDPGKVFLAAQTPVYVERCFNSA